MFSSSPSTPAATGLTSSDGHLLPTPTVSDASGGHLTRSGARGHELLLKGLVKTFLPEETGPLLKTPTAQLGINGGPQHPDKRRAGGHGPTLEDEVTFLLPTPNASDFKGSNIPVGRTRSDGRARTAADADLPAAVTMMAEGQEMELLPTPMAGDAKGTRNATANRTPGKSAHSGMTLSDVFYVPDETETLLATPRSQSGGAAGNPSKEGKGQSLATDVMALLPTPTGQNSHGNTVNSRGELLLPGVVQEMALLPSPVASDGERGSQTYKRGNPTLRGAVLGTADQQEIPLLPTPLTGEARHGSPNQHRSRGDTMLTGEILRLARDEDLSPTRQARLSGGTGESTSRPSGDGSEPAA